MTHHRSVAVLLVAATLTAGATAAAQEVGTATAVNPTTESTRPGATTVTLNVGARIVRKERIHTTPSGTVQLLFVDKSTLSIAPNTNILIDEYVYDPSSNSGHMLTNLTEGALRFVGGALSHQGEASITTTNAAVGIRGGTVMIIQDKNGTKVIDLFGVVTTQNSAGTVTMSQPGYFVLVTGPNTPPSPPQRVDPADMARYLALLTSKPGQNGGVPGLTDVTIHQCGEGLLQQSYNCPNTPWIPTTTGESNAFQIIIQATQHGTETIPPPRRGN